MTSPPRIDPRILKPRNRAAVAWPLRRALNPRFEGLLNELSRRQELHEESMRESMDAVGERTRLLQLALLDREKEPAIEHSPRDQAARSPDLAAFAIGALCALHPVKRGLLVGSAGESAFASLGIEVVNAEADDGTVDAIVIVSEDLRETVPLARLAPGGTLIVAAGPSASADNLSALVKPLVVRSSFALLESGAAGWECEPHDPQREGVARVLVAFRGS